MAGRCMANHHIIYSNRRLHAKLAFRGKCGWGGVAAKRARRGAHEKGQAGARGCAEVA